MKPYPAVTLISALVTGSTLTSVFIGAIQNVLPVLGYKPTTLQTVNVGDWIEIAWNGRTQADGGLSYQFMQNSWTPVDGLLIRLPDHLRERRGNVEFYEEIVYRVRKGQSILVAVDAICMRIQKYKSRGFTLTW